MQHRRCDAVAAQSANMTLVVAYSHTLFAAVTFTYIAPTVLELFMGKLIVALLATILTMGALLITFPGLHTVAFTVGQHGIKWAVLMGGLITYTYYKIVTA